MDVFPCGTVAVTCDIVGVLVRCVIHSSLQSPKGRAMRVLSSSMAGGVLLAQSAACSSGPAGPVDGEGGTRDPGAGTSRGGTMTGNVGLGSGGTSAGAGGGVPWTPSDSYFDGTSRLGGLPVANCTITVTLSEVSPHIPTVGIVSFASSLSGLTAAEVHFGQDTAYGLVAPVDLHQDGFRTLLLGMAENRTYHFRVAVSDGNSVCYGEDRTIETGSLNTSALAEAWTRDGAAPGFIVTARDGKVVIFNKWGELVWAHSMWNVFSVQMSWDGQFMIGRDAGPFDSGSGGTFYRVAMDGGDMAILDAPGGDHHDFAAIPGGIAYLAKTGEGECDRVYVASTEITDGVPVFDTWQIYQYFPDEGSLDGAEICHANRIHYSRARDMYTISDRNKDSIAVFARSGTPITSIGKTPTGNWTAHIQAEGTGPGGDWHVQHGHHFYNDDKLVVFSNESRGGAAILHYTISGNSATLDWKYGGAGPSMIQGDVQRLPNGNFLVTANLSGTIVEVGPEGTTEVGRYVLAGPVGPLYGFTYARHRPTLYGSPAPR